MSAICIFFYAASVFLLTGNSEDVHYQLKLCLHTLIHSLFQFWFKILVFIVN